MDLSNIEATTSFNKKREVIQKYIKEIILKYIPDQELYVILIEFVMNKIENEVYVLDHKYDVAINLFKKIFIPLSKRFKELKKTNPEIYKVETEFRMKIFNTFDEENNGLKINKDNISTLYKSLSFA